MEKHTFFILYYNKIGRDSKTTWAVEVVKSYSRLTAVKNTGIKIILTVSSGGFGAARWDARPRPTSSVFPSLKSELLSFLDILLVIYTVIASYTSISEFKFKKQVFHRPLDQSYLEIVGIKKCILPVIRTREQLFLFVY